MACVDAARTYEPRMGTPFEAYFWRAILFAVRRAVWALSSPVSGGSHRPEETYATHRRAPLDAVSNVPEHTPPADARLNAARWTKAVRDRLVTLAENDLVAVSVVLGERDAKDAPDARAVARRAAALRANAKDDPELYGLMGQLKRW